MPVHGEQCCWAMLSVVKRTNCRIENIIELMCAEIQWSRRHVVRSLRFVVGTPKRWVPCSQTRAVSAWTLEKILLSPVMLLKAPNQVLSLHQRVAALHLNMSIHLHLNLALHSSSLDTPELPKPPSTYWKTLLSTGIQSDIFQTYKSATSQSRAMFWKRSIDKKLASQAKKYLEAPAPLFSSECTHVTLRA